MPFLIWFFLLIQSSLFFGMAAESTQQIAQRRVWRVFGEAVETNEWRPVVKGPSVLQPSYDRWKQLKKSMTKVEVKELLGDVVGDLPNDPDALVEFGIVQTKSPVFPDALSFQLWFSNDRLQVFTDPFNGRFSTNGMPISPELIMPHDGMVFDHYPRFLDFRWYPAAGIYPMNYEVEIQTRLEDEWSSTILEVESPYANAAFAGANEGRWRVRAKNKKGVGEWSGFRRFAFSK